MKLKDFDLERFLAGDEAITRNGKKILEYHLFKSNINKPLFVLIEGNDHLTSLNKYGKHYDEDIGSPYDLFMVPKTKKVWIAIDRFRACDHVHEVSNAYDSQRKLLESEISYTIPGKYIIKEIEIEV
jgi:hypothetical protein